MMNKSFLQDPDLSAKAKGILAYFLTLPDDWQIYLTEISTHFRDGKESIRQGVKELVENGYIIRSESRIRDEKGHLKGYTYDVFEVSSKNRFSYVGKSYVGKSVITNNDCTNNDPTNRKNTEKNLCGEIQKILGESISKKKVDELIKMKGADTVESYISNWDKYRPHAKTTQASYFIYAVQNDLPAPKQISPQGRLPNYANFDQREYTEEELEQFYITASNPFKR
jgi:hypothetical protein